MTHRFGIGGFDGEVCYAVERALDAAHVQFLRDHDSDAYRLRFVVPDLVPSLRRFDFEISGFAVRTDGRRAFVDVLGDVAWFVDRERETRRWAAVDP